MLAPLAGRIYHHAPQQNALPLGSDKLDCEGGDLPQRCAYCDGSGPLTRDHVWPECFLDRTGRVAAHFSHQSERAHGADYVVGDVCSRCNNDILSKLDDYLCRLYDEYFAEARGFGATVVFRYDYHLLVRTLLKIAYNSARAAGSDHEHLRRLRSYILLGEPVPTQLALFAEIVSPTLVADSKEPSGNRTVLPSGFYRSAITRLLTPHGDRLRPRIVAIDSFYFHLLLPAVALADSEFEEAAAELGEYVPGVVRLSPLSTELILKTSPQDAISSAVPHVRRHEKTYREFFKRRKA